MKDYFEAEMRLLNEAAIEFSHTYPEQANMLNLAEVRDRDPYIERLLEGMAYLTAHIRSRIDDDVPEICQTLLSQMWPHFIRPFPSSTIIEFKPNVNQLQDAQSCDKGTKAISGLVGEEEDKEKVYCQYRTTSTVVLNPIRVANASMNEAATGGTLIRIDIEIGASTQPDKLDLSNLTFYLHGYPSLTLDLWCYLTRNVCQVRVRIPSMSGDVVQLIGGQDHIKPAHMSLDTSILPKSGRSFVGTHLLLEYFSFREKFLFFNISGLDHVEWPDACKKFAIEIHVDSLIPTDYRIDENTFRLHCVPAVNLYPTQSEPVNIDFKHSEYRVLADVNNPNSVLVYSLDSVEGVGATTGHRSSYHSIHELNNGAELPRHYHVTNSDRGLGREETFISIGGASKYEPETLSCSIHAYNGHFPRRYLYEGSIKNDKTNNDDLEDYVELTNITRPSPTYMPPKSVDYTWGLVAHLGLNYSSVNDVNTLKRVLYLYEWTGRKDNQRKIDGIKDVNVDLYQEMHRGALMRGMEVTLTLHEGNYASISDVVLFGQILNKFFAMYANVNTVVRTRVQCHPSGKEYLWQPVLGETSLM